MNDVVFVIANSRLQKQKEVRKTKDYNIDDLASDDKWTGNRMKQIQIWMLHMKTS